jgi:hypothetical protein
MISAIVIRAILLLSIATELATVSMDRVVGSVTDAEGSALADVRVMSPPSEDGKTDSAGRFVVEHPGQLIRFSRSGYRPVTAAASGGRLDIVLQRSTGSAWSPPPCSPAGPRRFGETIMFSAPPGVRLYATTDVDYRTVAIRFRDTWLEFGTGAHWTYGLPVAQVLQAMALVHERDVDTPWGDPAAEYRGVRKDGKHWRGVYSLGRSISYDHADAIAAKYFDAIIDSLCFKWPPSEPPGLALHPRPR